MDTGANILHRSDRYSYSDVWIREQKVRLYWEGGAG